MNTLKSLWKFLTGKRLWINIAAAVLLLILLVTAVSVALKNYTHHNQALDLPDFNAMYVDEAALFANERTFELVVSDSVHIVGEAGGKILSQNPKPGAKVKEGRTVYVTITKRDPDMVKFQNLPVLYGKNFERKKRELAMGYKLESRVVGKQYDPGPPGHILQVIYKGDTVVTRKFRNKSLSIPKGDRLDFIISKSSGGQVQIPKLVCETYASAKFILTSYKLELGGADADGTVTDFDDAYVWKQEPEYAEDKKIEMGTAIKVYLTQARPPQCSITENNSASQ